MLKFNGGVLCNTIAEVAAYVFNNGKREMFAIKASHNTVQTWTVFANCQSEIRLTKHSNFWSLWIGIPGNKITYFADTPIGKVSLPIQANAWYINNIQIWN